MSLRPFLSHLERHPDAAKLAEPDTHAFVSASLKPYLIAAVAMLGAWFRAEDVPFTNEELVAEALSPRRDQRK